MDHITKEHGTMVYFKVLGIMKMIQDPIKVGS